MSRSSNRHIARHFVHVESTEAPTPAAHAALADVTAHTLANSSAVIAHVATACCVTGRSVLTAKSHSSSLPSAVTAPNTVLLCGHHATSSTCACECARVRTHASRSHQMTRGAGHPADANSTQAASTPPHATHTPPCCCSGSSSAAAAGPPATAGPSSRRCRTGTAPAQRGSTAARTRGRCGRCMSPGTARCSSCCTCGCARPRCLRRDGATQDALRLHTHAITCKHRARPPARTFLRAPTTRTCQVHAAVHRAEVKRHAPRMQADLSVPLGRNRSWRLGARARQQRRGGRLRRTAACCGRRCCAQRRQPAAAAAAAAVAACGTAQPVRHAFERDECDVLQQALGQRPRLDPPVSGDGHQLLLALRPGVHPAHLCTRDVAAHAQHRHAGCASHACRDGVQHTLHARRVHAGPGPLTPPAPTVHTGSVCLPVSAVLACSGSACLLRTSYTAMVPSAMPAASMWGLRCEKSRLVMPAGGQQQQSASTQGDSDGNAGDSKAAAPQCRSMLQNTARAAAGAAAPHLTWW
jgi:hypothetical protein